MNTPSERPDETLREAEERYRALFDSLDCVYLHDLEGRFIDANAAALELLGYEREDIPSLSLSTLLSDDQLRVARRLLAEVVASGALKTTTEFAVRRKTGECVSVEIQASVVLRDAKPYAMLGIARDVTAQKQLAASLRKAQFSVDHVADSVHWLDRDGRIVDAGRSMCSRLGYPREELLGMSVVDITVDESPDTWLALWRLLNQEGPQTFERQHRTKSGDVIPVEIWSSIVEYEGQEAVLAIARDITERKLAAEAVRQSSELFTLFLRNSPIYSYIKVVTPTESRVLHASENYRDMLGLSSAEMIGKTMVELFPEERAKKMMASDWAVVSTGQTLRFEEEVEGRRFTTIKFPMVRGGETLLAGYSIDVTEASEAQQALRASEQALKSYFDNASDAVYVIDLASGSIRDCNAQACLGLGYSRDELLRLSATDIECGLAPAQVEAIHAALKPGQVETVEGLHRRKDGSIFPIEARLNSLAPARPDLAVSAVRDITARKEMQEVIQQSEADLRAIVDATPFPVALVDPQDDVILYWSRSALSLFGHTAPTAREWYAIAYPDPDYRRDVIARWKPALEKARASGGAVNAGEYRVTCRDGSVRTCELYATFLADRLMVTFNDLTERKRAEKELREREEQLRQAQKMEAVGQLAGGIAHDFNNLLAAILGYCDLLLANPVVTDSSALEDLEEIRHAGERASALTRQILAFSRRQALDPRVVSLGEIVIGMAPLLGRTLGEDIRLVTRVDSSGGWVEADANQLEQVIMNLAVNARDAMPSGGRLTLQVADVELSERFCRSHPGTSPGAYVRLTVADTGVGMDAATRDRIFEPFFTTKARDRGTGLGLSMAYGTVTQSNGGIFVQSRPGEGTKVKIYLPRVAPPTEQEALAVLGQEASEGSETILLVEDEAALRRFVGRVLEGLGYGVLSAGTAAEAVQLAKKAGRPIDLLLTDVVLPGGTNGDELARELTASRPELPVLYVSGYPHDAIVHSGRLDEGVNFLQKPFTAQALAAMVRDLLGRGDPTR